MDDKDGLPELTAKQQAFVEGIAEGLCKSDAYRKAYTIGNMKQSTIWRRAVEVSSNSKVKAWTEAIRNDAVTKLNTVELYTRTAYLEELEAVIQLAIASKSYGPALHGIAAKGKTCGHVTENHEHKHIHTADNVMLDKIEATMGMEARERAEEEMGLPTRH